MQKNLIFTLIFSILVAIFAVLNATTVTINFMFAQADSYLSVVILISATLGAIAAYTFNVFGKMKIKKEVKTLEKKLAELEKENEAIQAKAIEQEAIVVEKTTQDDGDDTITQ